MINENLFKAAYTVKGLTQEQVAKHLGITVNTLRSKVRKGNLEVRHIDMLIDFLDIENPIEIFFVKPIT